MICHRILNVVPCVILMSVFQRFIQYLASRNTLFNLSNFLDKSGSHGKDTMFYHFLADMFDAEFLIFEVGLLFQNHCYW